MPERRGLAATFMLVTASSYPLEALLYVYRRPTGPAPEHVVFLFIRVALVWTIFASHLSRARVLLWEPYVGVFVLGFLFESITTASLLATGERLDIVALAFNISRLIITLVLSIDGIFVILSCRTEQCIDEEAQPLHGHANVNTTQQK